MFSSNVEWEIRESVATLTFNRPHARNALTWDMYHAVQQACDQADEHPAIRVLVLRGAGGAFAAGTDISQFRDFTTGADGIEYERRLDAIIDRLERVSCPTIAAIDGPAAGGGCALALACDFRVLTTRARLGVPVARTLGNCLSMANTTRLVDMVGVARAKDLLISGRLVDATEADRLGLAAAIVPAADLDAAVTALATELAERAPSTIAATKALLTRLRAHRCPPPADDIIARCYESASFREGVAAFLANRPPRFGGRTR